MKQLSSALTLMSDVAMKTQRLMVVLALLSVAVMQPAWSKADCGAEATSLHELGEKAYDDGRDQDAARFYTAAAGECDNFDYWMEAGNVWVDDILAGTSASNVRENGGNAVRALQNAYNSTDDNDERIAASKGMIELGLMSDDPLNARNWLVHATQDLGAPESSVADLRARIDQKEQNLTADQVSRGAGKGGALLFDPVQLAGPAAGLRQREFGGGGWREFDPVVGEREFGGEGGTSDPADPGAIMDAAVATRELPGTHVSQTLNIPIKFEPNSTKPNAVTAGNIAALGAALTNDYPDATFRFVGHADARGDAGYNMSLSLGRAEEVRMQTEAEYPELAGRITTTGKGEEHPRELGNSEAAYRSNRRLEVFIEQQ